MGDPGQSGISPRLGVCLAVRKRNVRQYLLIVGLGRGWPLPGCVVEVMTRGNADPVGIWLTGNQPVKVGTNLLRKPGKLNRRELALSVERAGEGVGRHADTLSDIPVEQRRGELLQALEYAVSDTGHAPSLPASWENPNCTPLPSPARRPKPNTRPLPDHDFFPLGAPAWWGYLRG